MAKLIFYDDTHRYTVDGEEVPSVSELTRFITREVYETVPQTVMDNAGDRGTKVHKATEAIDKYGSAEIDDDLLCYLQAYVAFLKENSPKWEKIEWAVNNGQLYAGTIDRYGELDGKNVIVDIKTTATIGSSHKVLYTAAQNLYRMAIQAEHKVDAIYILQLKKDGKYRLIELDIDDNLANACITLHYSLKKKKKGEKNGRSN